MIYPVTTSAQKQDHHTPTERFPCVNGARSEDSGVNACCLPEGSTQTACTYPCIPRIFLIPNSSCLRAGRDARPLRRTMRLLRNRSNRGTPRPERWGGGMDAAAEAPPAAWMRGRGARRGKGLTGTERR